MKEQEICVKEPPKKVQEVRKCGESTENIDLSNSMEPSRELAKCW